MNAKEKAATPFLTMLAIVAIAFAVESAIMAGLGLWAHSGGSLALVLLDAVVLSLAIAPPTYWLVLRPIRREYERRLRAEIQAQALGRLAATDPLTRSMNRRGLVDALREAMAHAARYGRPFSLAMADIDHFKRINDTYGHEAGDEVLRGIASILSKEMRLPDRVGRYGGEEFLLILPETKPDAAQTVAERIRASVSNADFAFGRSRIKVTVSIGVTEFEPGETMEELLSRVDRVMYQAKAAGRDRVISAAAS